MSRRRFPVGDILWQWHQWRLIENGFQIRLASVIRDNHVRRRTLIFIFAHTLYQCWLCYLYRKLFIRTKLVVRCDTLKKCARCRDDQHCDRRGDCVITYSNVGYGFENHALSNVIDAVSGWRFRTKDLICESQRIYASVACAISFAHDLCKWRQSNTNSLY